MSDNNLYTVAFYNLENLFDTINDPNILDQDYTEDGRLQWDDDRYENKIYKLSKAIAHIGAKTLSAPPTLLGVAEVENNMLCHNFCTHLRISTISGTFFRRQPIYPQIPLYDVKYP